jgi:hypothetical protein
VLALATTSLDRLTIRLNGYAVDHGNWAEFTLLSHMSKTMTERTEAEAIACVQMGYIAAALGHYTGSFLNVLQGARDVTLTRRFDYQMSAAFSGLLSAALLSCFQGLDTGYPSFPGWQKPTVFTQAVLTAASLLDAISKDNYEDIRQNVNKYVDTCVLNLWNGKHVRECCAQNMLCIRLLLTQTIMSKTKIDVLLSRGEEDEEDRDFQMPE